MQKEMVRLPHRKRARCGEHQSFERVELMSSARSSSPSSPTSTPQPRRQPQQSSSSSLSSKTATTTTSSSRAPAALVNDLHDNNNNSHRSSNHDHQVPGQEQKEEEEEDRSVPKGYICPLTLEVMFDPVLDAEGNTYEREALLQWLKNSRTSPISRQPLSERMILPNIALREAIHEFMGSEWVQQRRTQQTQMHHQTLHEHPPTRSPSTTTTTSSTITTSAVTSATSTTAASTATATSSITSTAPQQGLLLSTRPSGPISRFRAKVELYLEYINNTFNNVSLQLNEHGCCAFRYHDFTVVLDVPEKVGVFCLYTRDMIPPHYLTPSMKTLLLELNFLQGDTRGGCLSVNRTSVIGRDDLHSATPSTTPSANGNSSNVTLSPPTPPLEQAEVLFSYTDRVTEVSAQEFANILLNFVETALQLRNRLLCHYANEQHQLAAAAAAAAASFQQQQLAVLELGGGCGGGPHVTSSRTLSSPGEEEEEEEDYDEDESTSCCIMTRKRERDECTVSTDHAVMSRCSDEDDDERVSDQHQDQEQHQRRVQRLLLLQQQQQQQYLLQQQNLDRLVRRLEAITEQAKRNPTSQPTTTTSFSTATSSSSPSQRTWY